MLNYASLPDGTQLGKIQAQILKEARYRYVGYDLLERKTDVANRGTLHVMVKRLVDDGRLSVIDAGTTSVKFKSDVTPIINSPDPWHLYMIECRSGAYYTGISNDVGRRYTQHEAGKGAKYTRTNPPVRLVGSFECGDRSAASKAEAAFRKLTRSGKRAFMESNAGSQVSVEDIF